MSTTPALSASMRLAEKPGLSIISLRIWNFGFTLNFEFHQRGLQLQFNLTLSFAPNFPQFMPNSTFLPFLLSQWLIHTTAGAPALSPMLASLNSLGSAITHVGRQLMMRDEGVMNDELSICAEY